MQEDQLQFKLDPGGVAPLNVVVVHPDSTLRGACDVAHTDRARCADANNGFHETCIRVAVQYYVENQLVVRLVDGQVCECGLCASPLSALQALVQLENFQLLVRFANISIPLDKNTKYPRTCESILEEQGLYHPPQ